MRFLSGKELGLWYVYIAIANLSMLFEFGFNPTFARNIVYVISGARKLSVSGFDLKTKRSGIDWHLLNVIIRTSKFIYACISLIVLLLLSTLGSFYINYISHGIDFDTVWISWLIFCISIFLNIYFLYSITILRGYGDIEGENKAKTFAKIAQFIISVILLLCGFGLIGASLGYLINAVFLRCFALFRMHKHDYIEQGRKSDHTQIKIKELLEIFNIVYHLAWRDGFVQFAFFASTQATSIFCSLFLSLEETGTFSVLLQLVTALYNFATAYPKSFFPAIQSAYADGDIKVQRELSSKGIVVYWILFLCGAIGILIVILPFIPLIKPGTIVDYGLYIGLCVYLALLQQHSIFCNFIISMNEIPYMKSYVVSAILGIVLTYVLCDYTRLGAWGIVLGQAIPQLLYNNWEWPSYYCRKMSMKYFVFLKNGCQMLCRDVVGLTFSYFKKID